MLMLPQLGLLAGPFCKIGCACCTCQFVYLGVICPHPDMSAAPPSEGTQYCHVCKSRECLQIVSLRPTFCGHLWTFPDISGHGRMSGDLACPDKTVGKCPGQGHVADMSRTKTNDTKLCMILFQSSISGLILSCEHFCHMCLQE
jgi:hypothetical protein